MPRAEKEKRRKEIMVSFGCTLQFGCLGPCAHKRHSCTCTFSCPAQACIAFVGIHTYHGMTLGGMQNIHHSSGARRTPHGSLHLLFLWAVTADADRYR